jgi:hypothetical protein
MQIQESKKGHESSKVSQRKSKKESSPTSRLNQSSAMGELQSIDQHGSID